MSSTHSYTTRNFECGLLFQTLRQKARLRQQDIATMVGAGVNTVQYWESGTTYPKVETLKKLLEVYLRFELFSSGQELAEAEELWERVRQEAPRLNALFDHAWFGALLANVSHSRQLKSAQKSELPPLPNNLPARLTSFVGRKKELTTLSGWLRPVSTRPAVRLVTLSGAGGCGKTSLAVQIAREVLASYPHGVWLVELAPLSTASGVAQALAATLGLKERPGSSLLATITDYLREKQVLLVLDNCEHLIEECAHLVDHLLRDCPGLVVLATSREMLKVSGETIFRVPSLTLPPGNALSHLAPHPSGARNPAGAEDLMAYEAIELFVERGKSASPHFELNEQNKAVVIELCQRLDGIPLALELAAARLRVLSVFELNERLADRFRLLRSGNDRTVLPRHQTLKATVEWSYDLLSESERLLFRRLSVFAGGWTLGAAEEICALDGLEAEEILDLLHELVNKSLVIVEEENEEASVTDQSTKRQLRFKLLETLREYGWEQLSRASQTEGVTVQDRHLACFTNQAEQIDPRLQKIEAKTGLEQLEIEHDNLRRALNWCLEGVEPATELESETTSTALKERTTLGLRMGGALVHFWDTRGYFKEGQEFLEKLRSQAECLKLEPTTYLTRVTSGAGTFNGRQGNYSHATELFKESLKLASELGDKLGVGNSLMHLSIVAGTQGNYQLAQNYLKQALALLQELGYKPGITTILVNLGNVAFTQGDYLLAQDYFQKGLAVAREIGNKTLISTILNNLGLGAIMQGDYWLAQGYTQESLALAREIGDELLISTALSNLGLGAVLEGEYQQARRYYRESLIIRREIGDKRGVGEALAGYCTILMREAQQSAFLSSTKLEQACHLAGAATGLFAAIQAEISEPERSLYQKTLETLREQMSEEAFNTAFEAGQAMILEEAVAYALAEAEESARD